MRRAVTFLGLALAVSVFSTGCIGRAVKEGLGAATGPKGYYAQLEPASWSKKGSALSEYTHFEMDPITDSFANKVPRRLLNLLPEEFNKQLARRKIPNVPSGKTLLVRGHVFHYEAEGTMGELFGPFEEVIARVELVDKASGKVLAVANCIGRTNETVNRGVDAKAGGLAKAIVNWIASQYPKSEMED